MTLVAVFTLVGTTRAAVQEEGAKFETLWRESGGESGDWETERQSAAASAVLKKLARRLEGRDEADATTLFGAEFRANALRPGREVARDSGGFTVEIAPSSALATAARLTDPLEALGAFVAPLVGGTERRISFKVVSVVAEGEASFDTEVIVHTVARFGEASLQQNARWRFGWREADGDIPPRIVEIVALSLEEVRLARRPFQDGTRAALGAAGGSTEVLAAGCEYWHGRLDDLGEPNVYGHNGIAIGDVNGDELDDLYVAQGTGLPNLLFVQLPDGTFEERGESSGTAWLDDTKGVLLADFDEDGDRDLLCAIGPVLVLSTNDGAGQFTPARSLGSASTSSFYSLAAADYDLDGDLDIFAVRYVETVYGESVPMPFHDARNGPKNHLMRNDGEAGFVDVIETCGIDTNNDRFSLAAVWADYDDDGDPDLYVANDFGRNNLYRNDGGSFVDVAAETGTEDQSAGMGASWADCDLDGRFDLLVSNMFSSAGRRIAYQSRFKAGEDEGSRRAIQRHALGNSLFCATGDGSFEEVSDSAGIRMGRWSWGSLFSDIDGDGLPDVVVPNGFLTGEQEDEL